MTTTTTITVSGIIFFVPLIILAIVIYWQYSLISALIDKLNYTPPKLEWRKQLNEDIDNILKDSNETDSQEGTNQPYSV